MFISGPYEFYLHAADIDYYHVLLFHVSMIRMSRYQGQGQVNTFQSICWITCPCRLFLLLALNSPYNATMFIMCHLGCLVKHRSLSQISIKMATNLSFKEWPNLPLYLALLNFWLVLLDLNQLRNTMEIVLLVYSIQSENTFENNGGIHVVMLKIIYYYIWNFILMHYAIKINWKPLFQDLFTASKI